MSLFDEPAGIPAKPPRKPKAPKTSLEDLPAHVKTKLQQAGAADFTTAGPPAVRKAHMITCPNCKKPVMRGLLAMPTPWPVDADPAALTPQGEALALLTGRKTYNLRWAYNHYELDRRGNWHLHNPNPNPHCDIVCDHNCDDPRSFTTQPTLLPPLKTFSTELPEQPPY